MSRRSLGGHSGGHQERETRVNIRGLDATGPRSLLLIDGVALSGAGMAFAPSTLDHSRARGWTAWTSSRRRVGRLRVRRHRRRDQCGAQARFSNGRLTSFHFEMPIKAESIRRVAIIRRTWDGGDITLTYECWTSPGLRRRPFEIYHGLQPGVERCETIGSSMPARLRWQTAGWRRGTSAPSAAIAGPSRLHRPGQIIDWAALTANAAISIPTSSNPLKSGWNKARSRKIPLLSPSTRGSCRGFRFSHRLLYQSPGPGTASGVL